MSRATQMTKRLTTRSLGVISSAYKTRPILVEGAIGLSTLLLLFAIVSVTNQHGQATAVDYEEALETVPTPVTEPQLPTVDPVSSAASTTISQSSTQSHSSQPAQASANVAVNGKNIPLPASGNGTIHKKIRSSDGSNKTSVDITVKSSAASSDSSSLDIQIDSDQSSLNNTE